MNDVIFVLGCVCLGWRWVPLNNKTCWSYWKHKEQSVSNAWSWFKRLLGWIKSGCWKRTIQRAHPVLQRLFNLEARESSLLYCCSIPSITGFYNNISITLLRKLCLSSILVLSLQSPKLLLVDQVFIWVIMSFPAKYRIKMSAAFLGHPLLCVCEDYGEMVRPARGGNSGGVLATFSL